MRALAASLTLALACSACTKTPPPGPPPPPPTPPAEVKADGALHAVRCGNVTAEWLGEAPGEPAPLEFGVTALRFRFADGGVTTFEPAGSLDFSDWSFGVFSPDCARLALPQDHYGPYHLVKVAALPAYLAGGSPEALVEKKGEPGAGAMVHSDFLWLGPDRFEFFASCCGGVEVFQATVAAPTDLKRKFFAGHAPNGVQRLADGGWENKP